MNSNRSRCFAVSLGTAAGGLLAAAFLPMAVAFADEIVFTPDPTTFGFLDPDIPQIDDGIPPFYQQVIGTDAFNADDLTTNTTTADAVAGIDAHTTFLSITNDDLFVDAILPGFAGATDRSQIDVLDFGNGFANQWTDIAGTGPGTGVADLFITPFGDFNIPV